jgi:cytochrome P450
MTTTSPTISRIDTLSGPAWHVTRYELVKSMLADRRLDMSQPDPQAPGWYVDSRVHRAMVRLAIARKPRGLSEEEDRALRRRCMNRIFSVTNLARVTPLIRAVATQLIDELIERRPPADLCESFSGPLCARMIGELLELPADDVERFRVSTGRAGDQDGSSLEGAKQVMLYVNDLVRDRRRQPGSDMISVLLEMEAGESTIQERRVVNLLAWMLALGWQPPAACIDWGTVLLLTNTDQHRLFQAAPERYSTGAVEEVLRLFNPQQATDGASVRYALTDVEVDGVTVSAGDTLLLDIWAANRDAEVFRAPDKFDIQRDPNPHLTFGYGHFMCNFGRIAREEIDIGLTSLFTRIPGLRLAVPPEQLEFKDQQRPAGVMALPVTW